MTTTKGWMAKDPTRDDAPPFLTAGQQALVINAVNDRLMRMPGHIEVNEFVYVMVWKAMVAVSNTRSCLACDCW